jgi:K+-sensing histidine kinase KdpD
MCPRCRSQRLITKHVAGIERLKVYFTDTRKYRCKDCNNVFRAPDRRLTPRDSAASAISREPDAVRSGTGAKVSNRSSLATRRSPSRHYWIALFAAAIASGLTWAMYVWTGKALLIFFILAVIVSAAQGIGVGLLAMILSVCSIRLVYPHSVSVTLATHSIIGLFAGIGIVTIFAFHELHRRNAALDRARSALELANQRLRQHADSMARANAALEQQRGELAQAHEQLRRLGNRLTNDIRTPLKIIDLSTDTLVRSDEAGMKATSCQVSAWIKREVQEMDTLIDEFARAC